MSSGRHLISKAVICIPVPEQGVICHNFCLVNQFGKKTHNTVEDDG